MIQLCKDNEIPTNCSTKATKLQPAWFFDDLSVNTSLHHYTKSNTSTSVYKKSFASLRYELSDHKFLFTDGSKNDSGVTYSITSNDNILEISHLHNYSSIFSAEIIAIYQALNYIKKKSGKFAVCTDSLASLYAIGNISNNTYYASAIRNVLIERFPNIKLIWIPGHSGIRGNELADNAAKDAGKQPLTFSANLNHKDLKEHIVRLYTLRDKDNVFNTCSSWYRLINKDRKSIADYITDYGKGITRQDCNKFIRLRLGHTRLTHGNLFNANFTAFCSCNISYPTSPKHFLLECPMFNSARLSIFQNSDPLSTLSHPSMQNIALLTNFLKTSKLYNEI